MKRPKILVKKRLLLYLCVFELAILLLSFRVFYIQYFKNTFYQTKAYEQQTRDRLIAANRGDILDRNNIPLATIETSANVSVINAQIKEPEKVAKILSEKLEMDYNKVLEKVNKKVALERIKIKVDKDLADEIRNLKLDGVVIDEDVKRIYPYENTASQVIGFVGKDNQGIIGLESKYDEYLKGERGKILTETDARGIEMENGIETRQEPVNGYNLKISMDLKVQQFAEQTLDKALQSKNAKRGAIIVLNPQNGEIYALANKPDFDLNKPFEINDDSLKAIWNDLSSKEQNDALNKMWRNFSINDTYEPGSTFKVITSSIGLEEKKVTLTDTFNCGGGRTIGGRYIKCWRSPRSHGTLTFVEGVQNSCNPVFMDVAERIGSDTFYDYMIKFGFSEKTGVDLPGEAVGIMHKKENIGPVELATMSFGQTFQITPLQLLRGISSVINGGNLITPHFALELVDDSGKSVKKFDFKNNKKSISKETSDNMRNILESVVSVGTGKKTYIEGFRIGGKTATSEKLPRGNGKYIASFMAFSPAENPQVIALVLIDEPQGVYYGGQVAGPVMKELLSNILPYLGIEQTLNEKEAENKDVALVTVPDFVNMSVNDAVKNIKEINLTYEVYGEGKTVKKQFPLPGEIINPKNKIYLYT